MPNKKQYFIEVKYPMDLWKLQNRRWYQAVGWSDGVVTWEQNKKPDKIIAFEEISDKSRYKLKA